MTLTPLPPFGKANLEKLIVFLRALPSERFDLSVVRNETDCGTVACAIGWTPEVFPAQITMDSYGEPVLRSSGSGVFADIAMELFGREISNLFFANSQHRIVDRLPNCGGDASASQVANMLEKYIELTEAA